MSALYDSIGRTYTSTRRADPRIAAAIRSGIGRAETVLNVGAGAGSYEPEDVAVTAVEPSEVMIAQRPAGAAVVVRATAEDLPFADDSFDVVCAILSDHHWADRPQALRELRRVARRRVVLFNADPAEFNLFWMNREYLHGFREYLIPDRQARSGVWRQELATLLGPVEFIPVPLPHDCIDGFYGAYWRRPRSFLDPAVREGISAFAKLPEPHVRDAIQKLCRDLADGTWQQHHHDLLERDSLHLGYYVIIANVD